MNDFIGKTFGKKFGGGRKGAGGASIPIDPILKNVLDHIRVKMSDSCHLDTFTQPIFNSYSEKIRNENSNI